MLCPLLVRIPRVCEKEFVALKGVVKKVPVVATAVVPEREGGRRKEIRDLKGRG